MSDCAIERWQVTEFQQLQQEKTSYIRRPRMYPGEDGDARKVQPICISIIGYLV